VSYGLGHFGYDLTLAPEFKFIPEHARGVLDPHDPREALWGAVGDIAYFDIPPRSFVLARSVEYIRMPSDVFAIVTGKSTYARNGVIANVTPMEPGWEGYLTIELSNTATLPSRVWAGEGIVQCVFFAGDEPRLLYEGLYQNQQGVTIARVQ
jgi:dCTP deaminase